MKKSRIIFISIAVFILIVASISFTIIKNNDNKNKLAVTIYLVPNDAKMILDNNTQINNGQYEMSAGNYTISASRSGFKSQKFNLIVRKNYVNIFAEMLTANSNEGTQYLNTHADEITKLETLGDQQYTYTSNQLSHNYPLIKILPIDISPLYRIDYGVSKKYPNDPTKIAIYISAAHPVDKQYALSAIYDHGFDPSDYEIIFESL
jgi:hypothetical protein